MFVPCSRRLPNTNMQQRRNTNLWPGVHTQGRIQLHTERGPTKGQSKMTHRPIRPIQNPIPHRHGYEGPLEESEGRRTFSARRDWKAGGSRHAFRRMRTRTRTRACAGCGLGGRECAHVRSYIHALRCPEPRAEWTSSPQDEIFRHVVECTTRSSLHPPGPSGPPGPPGPEVRRCRACSGAELSLLGVEPTNPRCAEFWPPARPAQGPRLVAAGRSAWHWHGGAEARLARPLARDRLLAAVVKSRSCRSCEYLVAWQEQQRAQHAKHQPCAVRRGVP